MDPILENILDAKDQLVSITDIEIEKAYPEAYRLARKFHELYEFYAPQFGYETKMETRIFKPSSPNGRLMAKVCYELVLEELESKGYDR